jgi:hypothetical protein
MRIQDMTPSAEATANAAVAQRLSRRLLTVLTLWLRIGP